MGKFIDRIGEVNFNRLGNEMKIIRYGGTLDIDVEFENGYILKNRAYSEFKAGSMKSFYDKTVYNIGYLGIGNYEPRIENKITKRYDTWKGMLQRCYDEKVHIKQPTYIGCSVSSTWYNFQVFGKWFDENFYNVREEKMCLDKDILVKGNKIYSPYTCTFVPEKINTLFTKSNNTRGKFPIGVSYHKRTNKFAASCHDNSKEGEGKSYIGEYNTPIEAFNHYKARKEEVIKEVADKYKSKIPQNLYDAMYKYEVEITD